MISMIKCSIVRVVTPLAALCLVLLWARLAQAEILSVQEAENCVIQCAAGNTPYKEAWASNGAITPASWGDTQGDRLQWDINLREIVSGVWFGVRYAYDETAYLRARKRAKDPAVAHTLHLRINDGNVIVVPIPDTGGWNHYGVSHVKLPVLGAGLNTFRLYSPAEGSCANLDCCTVYTGPVDATAPGPLRPTRLAQSARRQFHICATPLAVLPTAPQEAADRFDQLYELMHEEYGTAVPTPIWVHFADPAHWVHRRRRAIRNRFGIYLIADGRASDKTDWCLTLADAFGTAPVPHWFFYSAARAQTELKWLPAIEPSGVAQAAREMLLREARELLDNPQAACRRPEVAHAAVSLKYGSDVFANFWRLVGAETIAQGKPLSTDGVLGLLSRAAGEDVTPLYRRWPGLATEGPVAPIAFDK